MKITTTMQNHLRRLDSHTFGLLRVVSRMVKDLYNSALYIQRQRFFQTNRTYPLKTLFQKVKETREYQRLSSDLAQQTLRLVNQNFSSFFALVKKKKRGEYGGTVRIPHYLDKNGHLMMSFIPRQFSIKNGLTRLSLGHRGEQSTGTRFINVISPPLGIVPKQIRIIPRYDALYFDIEYIYDIDSRFTEFNPIAHSYLSIDLGLDNFATCVTSIETAFIIEGRGMKSYSQWWNKQKSKYQSRLERDGNGKRMSQRMARMQRYRRDVINNYLNHVVKYIIDHCLDHRIGTIIVGDWKDMKRSLKMAKKTGQLFQTIPYRWFKQKLEHRGLIYGIDVILEDESYTYQDCFNCGLRRKLNRIHRGLYHCKRCGMELNADVNGALNLMKKVVPEQVSSNLQWDSGEITSPSRIRIVEFV